MTRPSRHTFPRIPVGLLTLAFTGFSQSVAHAAAPASRPKPLCAGNGFLCTETSDNFDYEYSGHDEPSLLFYSDTKGSGNSSTYEITLPTDPSVLPKQDGSGGTFNFQLHPAFWVGMALCDSQSAPNFTHAPCKPNSDDNIFDDPDRASDHYIGKHPGAAFLEVQFYPPGWAPWPDGISCDPFKWCAAMAIFSVSIDQNTGQRNNSDCQNIAGVEPSNFAFITLNGAPHAPPSPLDATLATFSPDATTDLFMSSGDKLTVQIHDTPAGLRIAIHDNTTGEAGSMTASVANGFTQVNFEPDAVTCSATPYAFHPMYATSNEHTRVPWAAHTYNIAFSDEIGHFEYCGAVDPETFQCVPGAGEPAGPDVDDLACFSPADSLRIPIGGCTFTDGDFDGTPYQPVWPGTSADQRRDRRFHPSSILFSSPLFQPSEHRGRHRPENYSRVAFEADLPAIEKDCNRATGEKCVNPPPGARFYPLYTTRWDRDGCSWQLGGAHIPGTKDTFGGTSTAEFGELLQSVYPGLTGPVSAFNNFRQIMAENPCRGHGD
jgi:hypothetical protein